MLLISYRKKQTIFLIKFMVKVDVKSLRTQDMTVAVYKKCFKFIKIKIYEKNVKRERLILEGIEVEFSREQFKF